ncbi:MAG: Gldg family protein [Myxococcota bacterium]
MMLERLAMPLMLVGLSALFLGERVLTDTGRIVGDVFGTLLILSALGLSIFSVLRGRMDRRTAALRVTLSYGLCVVALLIYVLQHESLRWIDDASTRVVLSVLWPTLLIFGLAPAVAMEMSLRATQNAPRLELWRIKLASRAAAIIVLTLVAFAALNYAASQWNRKIDLSYFRATRVGTSNKALVAGLTTDVRFVLFFGPGSDVLDYARAYLEELARQSTHIKIDVVDQALEPELARDFRVRGNGTLAVEVGGQREALRLGEDLEQASDTLKRLDGEVHKLLLTLLRPPKVAYLTTGHLERDWVQPLDESRAPLADFKKVLESLGFSVNRLGVAEGLASEIPDDASVVIVPGPLKPFLSSEREALLRYMERGGHVMYLMDPDHGDPCDALLEPLGVRVSKSLVATDDVRYMWGPRRNPFAVATNNASSHPSVTTLGVLNRLGVVLLGTGAVEKIDKLPTNVSLSFTLKSMPQAWLDKKSNGVFDQDIERRATLDYAAAIEFNYTGESPSAVAPTGDVKPQVAEQQAANVGSRALVFSDADIIGDQMILNQGNYALIADGIRWLVGDEDLSGTIESEDDVQIVHRKDEDTVWFYGTSIVAPVGVLVAGLMYTRRGRKKRGDV